jgi:hypothetical protein
MFYEANNNAATVGPKVITCFVFQQTIKTTKKTGHNSTQRRRNGRRHYYGVVRTCHLYNVRTGTAGTRKLLITQKGMVVEYLQVPVVRGLTF